MSRRAGEERNKNGDWGHDASECEFVDEYLVSASRLGGTY
jgi:hypothetical protein